MILKSLAPLVFPDRCVGCDQWLENHDASHSICPSCYLKLHFLKIPAFLPKLTKTYFDEAHSALAYEGVVLDWVHQYKFYKKFYFIPSFTFFLMQADLSWENYEGILFVPMHWRRRLLKGFNPSHYLGHSVAKNIGKPLLPALKKLKSTKPQTKLSAIERLKNVRGSFVLKKNFRQRVHKKTLLLVDDVLTTGATVNECAKVLLKAGAKKVDVLTLARPL